MAAYTANTTGAWNSATTWSGAGIPGSGDTGTINSGVTVTVPDGYTATVGTTSGTTGTVALVITSGGRLIVGNGASGALNLQGDVTANGTAECVTMQAGSQLRFVPASGQRITVNFATNNAGCLGTVNGTAGARCSILTDATALTNGGSKGYISHSGGIARSIATMTYCDCTDLDDGSINGFCAVLASTAGQNLTWSNNTFTRCSKVFINANGNNTGNVNYTNNTHSSSVLTGGLCFDFRFSGALTTGQRNITGNVFDLVGQWSTTVGCTIKWNVFGGQPTFTDGAAAQWAVNSYNLHTWAGSGTSGVLATGDFVSNYFAIAGNNNQHVVKTPSTLNYGPTIDSNVFECVDITSNGQGDCIHDANGATSGLTAKAIRNLILPTSGTNNQAGTITTSAGTNPLTWTIEHNTIFCGSQSALQFSESSNEPTGSVASFRANLTWNASLPAASSFAAYKAVDSSHAASGGTSNVFSPTAGDYNGSWNQHYDEPSTYPTNAYTFAGNGYQGNFTAYPGSHDVNGTNPAFVDSTRNIGTWAVHKGQASGGASYATQVAAAIAYVSTAPTTLIPDLIGWVQAGFAPTNSAYQAASYPGDSTAADAAGNAWPGGAPGIGAMGALTGGSAYGAGRGVLRPYQLPAIAVLAGRI